MIKIAIDAMGGDNAPQAVFDGVLRALDAYKDIEIHLYGDEKALKNLPDMFDDRLIRIPTTEVIKGEDEPVKAVRRKKDASMVVAAKAVREGKADVLLSAGNTGALLTTGLLVVGRIKGVDRPGLMPVIPTINEKSPHLILMDAGANAESKAEHLLQYAQLASYYAESVLKIEQARVGLVNNGTEAGKGDELRKQAYQLLNQASSLNFVGNIEAKDLLNGQVDIAVTDGFTGNAILKTLEGSLKSIFKLLKRTLSESSITNKIGGLLIKPSLKKMAENFDDSKQGGAVLLGVKKPVIKAHGSADDIAIYHAIRQAREIVLSGFSEEISTFFENSDKNDRQIRK
ncbi:phosphate acyltransferase PlsX [Facklamia sp. P12955]|uniref:phosphate acyltransferase PlsX n=1 Tax=Facklamia sp. P12955 TaxID=3421946 RepID=UPI003D171D8D